MLSGGERRRRLCTIVLRRNSELTNYTLKTKKSLLLNCILKVWVSSNFAMTAINADACEFA
jgi:hypothetical protein